MSKEPLDGRFRIGPAPRAYADLVCGPPARWNGTRVGLATDETSGRLVRQQPTRTRTKELILAEYDRTAAAGVTQQNPLIDGENYTSTLTLPPGSRHEGAGE